MSEKPTKVPRLNTHARDWHDYANQLERELAEATKLRDELGDALQRFVNRLQYSSAFMDGKMTCARVNRNPIKEWDEDCIFAFEVLEKLKGGEG